VLSASAKASFALCKSARERTAMSNETHTSKVFEIEKCRAKITGAGDLVDYIAPGQAGFGFFLRSKKVHARPAFRN